MKKVYNDAEIKSLKKGTRVEVLLRDMSGAQSWYPAVVSGRHTTSLEDYYERKAEGHRTFIDEVSVTVIVNGVEYPNYTAHAGACREA